MDTEGEKKERHWLLWRRVARLAPLWGSRRTGWQKEGNKYCFLRPRPPPSLQGVLLTDLEVFLRNLPLHERGKANPPLAQEHLYHLGVPVARHQHECRKTDRVALLCARFVCEKTLHNPAAARTT